MKNILIILLMMSFCAGSRIKVGEATSQEWYGGLPESGYGTDYNVPVTVRSGSDKLLFEGLWVDDIFIPVKVLTEQEKRQVKSFEKGDRLIIRAGLLFRPDENGDIGMRVGRKLARPIVYKGEGLLQYTYKGAVRYHTIEKFTVLEKIIYP